MVDFLLAVVEHDSSANRRTHANQQRASGTSAVCVVAKRRTGGVAGPRQSLLPLPTAVDPRWSRVRGREYSSSGSCLLTCQSRLRSSAKATSC